MHNLATATCETNRTKPRARILIVEDDLQISELAGYVLEQEGFEVITVNNGKSALETFANCEPSLVLLDIGLPDINGYSICRDIRKSSHVPVVFITGKTLEDDKLQGFKAGCDDYVTKPFSIKELLARIEAVLRRTLSEDRKLMELTVTSGKIKIDLLKQSVFLGEKEVELTLTEYKILVALARQSGVTVSSKEVIDVVWGDEEPGSSHALQVNICRLREKLYRVAGDSDLIETKLGLGYCLKEG